MVVARQPMGSTACMLFTPSPIEPREEGPYANEGENCKGRRDASPPPVHCGDRRVLDINQARAEYRLQTETALDESTSYGGCGGHGARYGRFFGAGGNVRSVQHKGSATAPGLLLISTRRIRGTAC